MKEIYFAPEIELLQAGNDVLCQSKSESGVDYDYGGGGVEF